MQFNIELKTYEEFKSFWETIAEREGYYFTDLLGEFHLDELTYDKELDFEDEDGNDNIGVWNDTIDDEYLTHYFFAMDDDWDRSGDVKTRMFIPMVNPISLDDVLKELPELEAKRIPIAKKFDRAMGIQRKLWDDEDNKSLQNEMLEARPSDDELAEMKNIENKLYFKFGIGNGAYGEDDG